MRRTLQHLKSSVSGQPRKVKEEGMVLTKHQVRILARMLPTRPAVTTLISVRSTRFRPHDPNLKLLPTDPLTIPASLYKPVGYILHTSAECLK
jgi:hypothetical protein